MVVKPVRSSFCDEPSYFNDFNVTSPYVYICRSLKRYSPLQCVTLFHRASPFSTATRKFASDHELSLEVGRQPRSAQDEEEERRKFMVRGDQATFEEWKVHSYGFESEWGAWERGREGATEVDVGYGRKMSKPVLY